MKEKKVGVHTCIRNTSFYLPGRSRRFSFPPSTTFPPFNRFTSFVQLPNKRQTPIRMYDVVFFFFYAARSFALHIQIQNKIIFFLCAISYAPVPSSGDDISTAARGRQCTVVKFQTPERKLLVRGGACRRAIQSKKKKNKGGQE